MKNITVTCESCGAKKTLANCTVKEISGHILACWTCKAENILIRVNDLNVAGVELAAYRAIKETLREANARS